MIAIAVQPAFLDWPQEPGEYLRHILGNRADDMIPLRSMLDAGLLLSAGSDAPCTVRTPLRVFITAATTQIQRKVLR